MFIYRAVNIYPNQIDLILDPMDGVGSEYQIILDHQDNGRDMMTLKVERSGKGSSDDDTALGAMISDRMRRKLLVRAAVEILDPEALPRTQRKSQRVFDNRNGNSS